VEITGIILKIMQISGNNLGYREITKVNGNNPGYLEITRVSGDNPGLSQDNPG